MEDFLNNTLFKNSYLNIDVKSLIIISITALMYVLFTIIGKRAYKKFNLKAPSWISFSKFLYRLSTFLMLILGFTIILESIGIKMADFMAMDLVKTDKLSITPSHLLFVFVIIFIARAISITIKSIFLNKIEKQEDSNYADLNVYKLINYILWILAVSFSLQTIGLDLTILFAGSAALLVGVGIGMQQIFNDTISGFFLLFERNLKIKDVVEVDGIIGSVKDIGIRTSRIVSRDNIEMIVPNSKLVSDTVVNWSYNDPKIRFFLKIGVAYGSDVNLIKAVLLEIASNHSLVLKKPTPIVFFSDFGESSLDFELSFWTQYSFKHRQILSDLRYAIDKRFREKNIQIPFPQRDVHIIKQNSKLR